MECNLIFADPAKVTFTPTIQYLPFRLAGVVQCYIKANPPLQYVTWTKDKRLLEPYQTKDIVIMNNGSLLFTRVSLVCSLFSRARRSFWPGLNIFCAWNSNQLSEDFFYVRGSLSYFKLNQF